MDLKQLKIEAEKEVATTNNLKDLNIIFRKYLGKNGEIAKVFSLLKNLSPVERKKIGQEANLVKKEIEMAIESKSNQLKTNLRAEKLAKEKIDVTRPVKKIERGHLHPLTLVQREVEGIFQSMGFEVVQGPEVETEWYNFDALNIPQDHPSRDMWDTFWLQGSQKISSITNKPTTKNPKPKKLLLRTHTSPVQVRYMEKNQPPLRIVVPGRVFRHEATDASHEIQFYQLEGLMVGKNISAANFKAVIEEFLKRFLKRKIEIRLRPSFFPFTEPSFEIDMKWAPAKERTSPTVAGRGEGWLEIMGAGMVHPNVFKAAGYIPSEWQGFAFGVGLDRLAMLKYRIHDIRLFYQNDLRFLKQF